MRQTTHNPAPTARTEPRRPEGSNAPIFWETRTLTRYRVALIHEEQTPFEMPITETRPAPAEIIRELVAFNLRQVYGALYFDLAERPIGYQVFYAGISTWDEADPRRILSAALLANAASLLLFHTHPEDDPEPSGDDHEFLARLSRAAEALGIPAQGLLVLGPESPGVMVAKS